MPFVIFIMIKVLHIILFCQYILINSLTLWVQICNMVGMRKLCFCLCVLLGVAPLGSANAYIDKQTAVVTVMDKTAGKVQTLALPVGTNVEHEKLNMLVRSCKQTDPFDAQDFFMFIEVNKSDEGKIFSGWMSANEPGDNPLQNADYDLWLVKCE